MTTARKITRPKTAKTDSGVLQQVLTLQKGATIFSQGAPADAVFVVHTGRVEVTVTSTYGKEALLRVIGPDEFFGEECLLAGSVRTSTATSSEASTVFRIRKRAMLLSLRSQTEFSNNFLTSLLARRVNLELDLCEQLFNHIERRLARVLLNLARVGRQQQLLSDAKVAKVSHASLAKIIGISRSRVSSLMNRFRKMGWIGYESRGAITVNVELLTEAVLASV